MLREGNNSVYYSDLCCNVFWLLQIYLELFIAHQNQKVTIEQFNKNLRCDWLWPFHPSFNVEDSFIAAVGKKPTEKKVICSTFKIF